MADRQEPLTLRSIWDQYEGKWRNAHVPVGYREKPMQRGLAAITVEGNLMVSAADKTAKILRGRPFLKGQSGNPAGRPIGSRNAATVAMEQLLDGEAEAIVRKAVQKAKQGDSIALRLCLERIVPPRKDRPINFALPTITSAADALKAIGALIAAVASGHVTPSEAAELSKLVEGFVKSLEITDLAERIAKLESATTHETAAK
jgi:hypothetical protein